MKLNERQRKFINAYMKSGNATQAAKDAGYSKKTAKEQGARLLSNANMRQEIERRQKISNTKSSMTLEQWREELIQIARAHPLKFMEAGPNGVCFKNLDGLPEEEKRLVSEISEVIRDNGNGHQKIKTKDSMKAYEMLGKHFGAYEKDNTQQKPTLTIKRYGSDEEVEMGIDDE